MRMTDAIGDIPGSRHSMDTVATPFNIVFTLGAGLTGSVLFIVGLIWSTRPGMALTIVPDPIVLMAVGMVCFSLFFPMFLALYYGRHLLVSIKRLEAANLDLRDRIAALSRADD